MYQVHHKERVHPGRPDKQELLRIRLERLPPHCQERLEIRCRRIRRRDFLVPRQTLHHLCHSSRLLSLDDRVARGKSKGGLTLLPLHHCCLYRFPHRCHFHERLLLRR